MVYHIPGPCCTRLTVSQAYDVPSLLCPKHMVYRYQYPKHMVFQAESQAYIYGVPGLVCPKYTYPCPIICHSPIIGMPQPHCVWALICPLSLSVIQYAPAPLTIVSHSRAHYHYQYAPALGPLSVCPSPTVSHSQAHYQYAPAQLTIVSHSKFMVANTCYSASNWKAFLKHIVSHPHNMGYGGGVLSAHGLVGHSASN